MPSIKKEHKDESLIEEHCSNTKVSFFEAYATAVQPFRNVVRTTPVPNAFTTMMKLDQNQTCSLHYAVDVLKVLIDGLVKHDQVHPCRGMVTKADLKDKVSFSI